MILQLLFVAPNHDSIGSEIPKKFEPPHSDHFYNYQSDFKSFDHFDSRFNRFLSFWNIKGASVAVAKDGKLIYAKGFGLSDVDNNKNVEPYNLFRIASVSKLITATAIMKLVEDGEITLEDKVFGPQGILNMAPYDKYRDKKVEEITVRHLLEHSGGWTTRYGDPLFEQHSLAKRNGYKEPLSSEDIIAIMLKKRLHFRPGEASYYSNLGFVILGKVIEAASGVDYELYVKAKILYPLGIFDMKLAGNYRDTKENLEVNYYEQPGAIKIQDCDGSGELVSKSNGGNNLKALEAAGGWIASSTDLMKLLLAIDGFGFPADILSEKSLETMATPKAIGYSPLGWRTTNRHGYWLRTGSFAGTSCVLKRRPDGISYVILCNTSAWVGPDFPFKMASFTDRELNRINKFPDEDNYQHMPSKYISLKN
ncbi:serine hydrolase domain-containing protein [Saccharicrinis sp. FJH62]|uniref:serine hydrolase domain-containing protein n=1 Tax=Saccharicrinis sp. FJH62 TaxID=3344657 RepID=UPI0035D52A93